MPHDFAPVPHLRREEQRNLARLVNQALQFSSDTDKNYFSELLAGAIELNNGSPADSFRQMIKKGHTLSLESSQG